MAGFQRGLNFSRRNARRVPLASTHHPLVGDHAEAELLQRAEQSSRQPEPEALPTGGHPSTDATPAAKRIVVRRNAPLNKLSVTLEQPTPADATANDAASQHPLTLDHNGTFKRGLNWSRKNARTDHPTVNKDSAADDDQQGGEDPGDETSFVAAQQVPAPPPVQEATQFPFQKRLQAQMQDAMKTFKPKPGPVRKSYNRLKQDFKDAIAPVDVPGRYIYGAMNKPQPVTLAWMLTHKVDAAKEMKKKQDDVVERILSLASVGPSRGNRYKVKGIWDADARAMNDNTIEQLSRVANRFAGSALLPGVVAEKVLGIKRDIIDPEDLQLSDADIAKIQHAVFRLRSEGLASGLNADSRLSLMRQAIREQLFGKAAHHRPDWDRHLRGP